MIPRRGLFLLLSLLLLVSSLSAVPRPQTGGRFFERTGYWVRGEFLRFYEKTPNAEVLFGDPITESMPDRFRPGIEVQYFERVRLERDPALPASERITLSDLGQLLFDETQRGDPPGFSTSTNMCRLFSQTGKYVCYAFRDFYDANQGAQTFGQPISDTEMVNGQLVQYFERARMEWHPERPYGQRVVLTELGRIYWSILYGSNGGDIFGMYPEKLEVNAFTGRPALAEGEEQVVFVIVRRNGQPVAEITPIVRVVYSDEREENFRPDQTTDESGLTELRFPVEGVKPNQVVQVYVEVEIPNGPAAETSTWFRIWW